jgi:hypothetical protein
MLRWNSSKPHSFKSGEFRLSALNSSTQPTSPSAKSRTPERWNVIEADVRRYLMPRFPYALYYRVLSDHIRILAFKHNSRHPDYWRYRLPDKT